MDLLERIKAAKSEEINDLVVAVLARYRELFPDWDINIISIERKDNKNEQLDSIIAMIEKLKDKQFM